MSKPDLLPHSSAQPRICPACEISLQMAAKDGKRANHVHFCRFDHWQPGIKNGDRAGVLALAAAQGGVVLRWELTGPLSSEEARHMADVYLSQQAALGVPVRNETAN